MKLRYLSTVAALALLTGCSEEEDPGEPEPSIAFCRRADSCPPDTSGVDLTQPVSFRNDVFEPIFQTSCNGNVCHGHQTLAQGSIWLGPESGEVSDDMLETIISALLAPSATAPELKNVEPNDPAKSFLMLKVDGCQDRAGLACEAQQGAFCDTACGDGMPQFDSPPDDVFPLSAQQRHAIRAWIAQGAQNN